MIRFDHVSFGYNAACSHIHDISFSIQKGEFVAIIGENGAGKTTVSKLMNGLLKPSSGSVGVLNMDTAKTKISRLARHIGFLFQNPDRQLCQNTVRREIRFGLDLVRDDMACNAARVEQVLAEFGFEGCEDPFTLSRGERQRVALASLIAVEPEIMVLDEPTTGLDYRECMHIMNLVRELNRKGVTVVMVSHDMEVVLDFAQRVLVMAGGKLLADGKTTDIFRNARVMQEASLLPPQITELAIRLGAGFEQVNSVPEMLGAIKESRAAV